MKSLRIVGTDSICEELNKADGKAYTFYNSIFRGITITAEGYSFYFLHIQGSPGAYPASVIALTILPEKMLLPDEFVYNKERKTASSDYLIRTAYESVTKHAKQNRGVDGSGSWQPVLMPQKILNRNLVSIETTGITIKLRISLPGDRGNKMLGHEAAAMFSNELPAIVDNLVESIADFHGLAKHCNTAEDHFELQSILDELGLIAFVADGSLLPRESGVSDLPLPCGGVPFEAPDTLAVSITLKNAGLVRGLGISRGVTTIIGGGFHGKSTLLNALADCVYSHIPGDGREQVATAKSAMPVKAEDGRSVQGVDISGFLRSLPEGKNPKWFSTLNASGSTSEAASIVEAAAAGAKLLLIDEDSSATNFLIRDKIMRELIPEEPIIPLFDRVRELFEIHGISTIIVAGGSSDYLAVSDNVIAMRNYRPVDMKNEVLSVDLPQPNIPDFPLSLNDQRNLKPSNFNPAYHNLRLNKTISIRIKPLREQEQILEYGMDKLDCSAISNLFDLDQMFTLGYALLVIRKWIGKEAISPSQLAARLYAMIEESGLDSLLTGQGGHQFLAELRAVDLAAAINRTRSLELFPYD